MAALMESATERKSHRMAGPVSKEKRNERMGSTASSEAHLCIKIYSTFGHHSWSDKR